MKQHQDCPSANLKASLTRLIAVMLMSVGCGGAVMPSGDGSDDNSVRNCRKNPNAFCMDGGVSGTGGTGGTGGIGGSDGSAGSGGTLGGSIPSPRLFFHPRFWNMTGWEPRADDFAYVQFTPSGVTAGTEDAAQDAQSILGGPLRNVPASQRMVETTAIEYMDQVLDQLITRDGFRIAYLGYDLEGWTLTPASEQNDPVGACHAGHNLAQQYGLPLQWDPTHRFAANYGVQVTPYMEYYHPQDKGEQATDFHTAIMTQRQVYTAAHKAKPSLIIMMDIAMHPKGTNPPLTDLLDYYYGLSDMLNGIGIWDDDGSDPMIRSFVLTVRPPSSPPAGNSAPVVSSPASAQPASAIVGAAVTFTARATDPDGDPLTYTWDFGDHTNFGDEHILVRGQTVTHAYAAAGTYTSRVTVTDARGGAARSTATVLVAP